MVSGLKIVRSALNPGRRTPRLAMPTLAAGRDVKRRTASSSVINFSSRTYCRGRAGTIPRHADAISIPRAARLPRARPSRCRSTASDSTARPDIVFAHDRDDHVGPGPIGDDEIHHRVARVLSHRLADLRQVLAFPLAQRRFDHGRIITPAPPPDPVTSGFPNPSRWDRPSRA